MNTRLSEVLGLGVGYRLQSVKESNKWIAIILSVLLTPLLLAIHLPVSLLLVGNSTEFLYAGMLLTVTHVTFAVSGVYLFPSVGELRWLLLRSGGARLLAELCLQHFKINIFYWGLWIAPLLVLKYLGESFSLRDYGLWLLLFTSLTLLSILAMALIRYRELFFPGRPFRARLPTGLVRYKRLLLPLAYFLFAWPLLDPEPPLALRVALLIGASVLVALGVNMTLENAAQVRFWMHARSCSRLQLLTGRVLKGLLLAVPLVMAMTRPMGVADLAYGFVILLAAGALSLPSYWARGRILVAPLLAVVGMGLLTFSG